MINFNYDFNLISLQSVEKNNFNNDFNDTNCCKIFGVFDDFISPCMNFNSRLNNIKELGDFSAKIGSYHLVYNNENNKNQRLLYVGLGSKDKYKKSPEIVISKVFKTITNKLKDFKNIDNIFIYLNTFINSENNSQISWNNFIKQIIFTINQNNYSFDNYKTNKNFDSNENSSQNSPENSPQSKNIKNIKNIIFNIFNLENTLNINELNNIKNQAVATADGINLARNLGNEPPNICTPKYLATTAENLAKQYNKISCKILNKSQIKAENMNALYAVGQGSSSENDAVFIELSYNGSSNNEAPIILIGKGVCFDTGGICLKPPANIDEMKFDMCGAASVLGTLKAVAEIDLPINLKILVPAVKNMPDGNAYLPGDVLTSLSGQTIEVLNTDAEGRLILCDALTYAERFNPKIVIDVATLTGACVVALGDVASGLYANDENLAESLLAASLQTNDKFWRLPLWEEYQEKIDSTIADVANTGGRDAGSITAACFLWRFAKKFDNWAHLDIAGSAWKSGKEKSATGRPVAALTQFLINSL